MSRGAEGERFLMLTCGGAHLTASGKVLLARPSTSEDVRIDQNNALRMWNSLYTAPPSSGLVVVPD